MAKFHLIYDMETLGQNTQTCPVVDCSYLIFDWDRFTGDRPYTFKDLHADCTKLKLDLQDQIKNYGCKTEKSTLDWWMQQSKEARDNLKPSTQDVSLDYFIDQFISDVKNVKLQYWWTRSNTFDPMIMQRIARQTGRSESYENALKFWLVRDTRTFIDAKSNFSIKNGFIPMSDESKWNKLFIAHDSRSDIVADVLRLQLLVRMERGLPEPE